MNVPLLDLRPQLAELREEIIDRVVQVIDSTRYIQGPELEALEQEVAEYCGTSYAVGVSSGTDALLVALMALDIGPGDKVLIPPFSFFATMGVVLRLGAEPVFADIDPISFNIDPERVEEVLAADTENTIKAMIPVHLYGQGANMERLLELSQRYGVPLVEDAAQAIGTEVPIGTRTKPSWHRAGSMGICGCFSFFPSKNLGGIGDGGMVVSQDQAFAEKVALLRNHGAHPKYFHALVGGNFRLDPIQAAVLRVKLQRLESWHEQRRTNARLYDDLFNTFGFGEDERLSIPVAVYGELAREAASGVNYHIYNQYVVRTQQRDALRSWLQDHGIGSEIYYPLGLHQQQCLRMKSPRPEMKHTECAAKETLALPIYPGLTNEMQEYVVKTIRTFFR